MPQGREGPPRACLFAAKGRDGLNLRRPARRAGGCKRSHEAQDDRDAPEGDRSIRMSLGAGDVLWTVMRQELRPLAKPDGKSLVN